MSTKVRCVAYDVGASSPNRCLRCRQVSTRCLRCKAGNACALNSPKLKDGVLVYGLTALKLKYGSGMADLVIVDVLHLLHQIQARCWMIL